MPLTWKCNDATLTFAVQECVKRFSFTITPCVKHKVGQIPLICE